MSRSPSFMALDPRVIDAVEHAARRRSQQHMRQHGMALLLFALTFGALVLASVPRLWP